MGNAHGGFLILAEEDFAENWDLYSSASWRSERVRELDALGGRQRPPVRRGQSFSLKADYIAVRSNLGLNDPKRSPAHETCRMVLPCVPCASDRLRGGGGILITKLTCHS